MQGRKVEQPKPAPSYEDGRRVWTWDVAFKCKQQLVQTTFRTGHMASCNITFNESTNKVIYKTWTQLLPTQLRDILQFYNCYLFIISGIDQFGIHVPLEFYDILYI